MKLTIFFGTEGEFFYWRYSFYIEYLHITMTYVWNFAIWVICVFMHTIIENIQEVLLQFLGNLEFPTVCATLQLLSQQTTTIENCGCVFIPLCPAETLGSYFGINGQNSKSIIKGLIILVFFFCWSALRLSLCWMKPQVMISY